MDACCLNPPRGTSSVVFSGKLLVFSCSIIFSSYSLPIRNSDIPCVGYQLQNNADMDKLHAIAPPPMGMKYIVKNRHSCWLK